jgi:hypothetical protein
MYKRSLDDSDAFWREHALATLDWFAPFTNVQSGSFQKGDVAVSDTHTEGTADSCGLALSRHETSS